ncbi:Endoglucanase Acf2 [Granulicella rosea]|uniref:glucan endo-1,3-beta-D-glucosidase n=1 Tax=Granulicella rosea TaxID=474952 RepID=A0A239MKB1_9BACT|nr:glycosyl hydrolase [Granulicella rosea]SNT42584.1 Endoglucanase Acf2 [Granulicella rosea]
MSLPGTQKLILPGFCAGLILAVGLMVHAHPPTEEQLRADAQPHAASLDPVRVLAASAPALPADALTVPPPPRFNRTHQPLVTHRFWAAKNWFPLNRTDSGGAYTMFPEPLAVQTTETGLLIGASNQITVEKNFFVHPIQPDFTIGAPGLKAKHVDVTLATDRLVEFDFGPLRTRVGRGMPFVYVTAGNDAEVTLTFVAPPHIFSRGATRLGVDIGQNRYGLFCPTGGSWSERTDAAGKTVFACALPAGRHYLSAALLTQESDLEEYSRFAFAFPTATPLHWAYNRSKSEATTSFNVETEQKEGAAAGFLQALYPHQYTALDTPSGLAESSYISARGPMRVFEGSSFTTVNTFHGILPFLPLPREFDTAGEANLIRQSLHNPADFAAPDTYGQGKSFGKLAELLLLAQNCGQTGLAHEIAGQMSQHFAQWSGSREQSLPHFRYNPDWQTLIGYPASYGSNTQLNDHHFHYGYWIDAAAKLGLADPAWLRDPGNRAFIAELTKDIANIDPDDTRYPVLRSFDAYAGHSWAAGAAPFGDGQNAESSSEAIHAWAGLILYAAEIHDARLEDAAVWMYTLETTAAESYWFDDGPVRTFPANFTRTQIANVFDGKADSATWFGADGAYEHGIQFLPFTGASLYLGRHPAYVRRNLREVTDETHGHIATASDKWPDLLELYQGFYDPKAALADLRNTPYVFDGETRAHELAWLSSLAAYGQVDSATLADAPFYAVFRNASGAKTHIAFNPGETPLVVHFSDGASLKLPPRSMSAEGRLLQMP